MEIDSEKISYRRANIADVKALVSYRVRFLNELLKEVKSLGLRYLHLNATEDGISIYRKAGFVEPLDMTLELRLE